MLHRPLPTGTIEEQVKAFVARQLAEEQAHPEDQPTSTAAEANPGEQKAGLEGRQHRWVGRLRAAPHCPARAGLGGCVSMQLGQVKQLMLLRICVHTARHRWVHIPDVKTVYTVRCSCAAAGNDETNKLTLEDL